jgi:polyferredoxin
MSDVALKSFLDSDYNLISDVKMYYFFANISRFSLIVIAALFILSIFIRNFWCRFLCPYGALLGIISFLSPHKIKRNKVSCIDCGLCAKACPAFIKVDKVTTVVSDECSTCLSCVDACPVADTLELKLLVTKKSVNKKYAAAVIVLIFIVITGTAKLGGFWQNNISKEQHLELYKNMHSIGHPTGVNEMKEYDSTARENFNMNNRNPNNEK